MKRALALFFLALACDVVDRDQSDYLMWDQEGRTWAYRVVEGDFPGDTFYLVREGTEDTSFSPETANVCLNWEGRREYFWTDGDRVDKFTDFSVYPGGEVIPLEQRMTLYLRRPPVIGNYWNDTSRGRAIWQGDTFDYYRAIQGSVDSMITMSVPYSQDIQGVYVLRVDEELVTDVAEERAHRVYYLGPNLGIIKAKIGPDTFRFQDSTWVEERLVLELLDIEG